MNWRPDVASSRNTGSERTCASCVSIGHGVAPHELVPALGALWGCCWPLGCTHPPPGRVCAAPLVYVGATEPVIRSTAYVAVELCMCVTRYNVSSVAESVTQGDVQKCVFTACEMFVTDDSVPAAA